MSASFDNTIRVWDALMAKKSVIELHLHSAAVRTCQWVSPTHIISGGYDRTALYTDMEVLKSVQTFKHEGFVSALRVNPTDRNSFFTGDSAKHVLAWDLRTNKCTNSYLGAGGQILDQKLFQRW